MSTWILTTGSSDIQLTTQDNWLGLCDPIMDAIKDLIFEPVQLEGEELWSVPARVLGLAYSPQLDDYFDDLYFPLFDSFRNCLNGEIPDRIILLLSDQSELFSDRKFDIKCPYWKDTCTALPIFERYLKTHFPGAKLVSKVLSPDTGSPGLDHWDSTLKIVQDIIYELPENKLKDKTFYVSHQAGTPAISSALQFSTLSRFGQKVKFLVSNEYEKDQAEIIEGSKYLRGIQVEQAKGLVKTAPGSAKKLLDKIDYDDAEIRDRLTALVDFFNLNRSLVADEDEFAIAPATRRIVDVLDLIGIFFSQDNYLQGITLLSAANETFLKVAILSKISDLTVNLSGRSFKGADAIAWTNEGLLLNSISQSKTLAEQKEILTQLRFPIDRHAIDEPKDLRRTNQNSAMLQWLQRLEPNFRPWPVLIWSCQYKRDRDLDLRNQLVHNLVGIKRKEVIQYLSGYKDFGFADVMEAYTQKVKQPFFAMIQLLDLPYKREKLNRELDDIIDSLR